MCTKVRKYFRTSTFFRKYIVTYESTFVDYTYADQNSAVFHPRFFMSLILKDESPLFVISTSQLLVGGIMTGID
jgi:hypothetical protein